MMSISEELNSLILQRKSIEGDVDYENDQVIQDEIQLMIKDINATVSFLENDCTEEQFIWLSEVFDEIAERSKSGEFIAAIRHAAKRFPQAVATYNINYFIDSAADYIN